MKELRQVFSCGLTSVFIVMSPGYSFLNMNAEASARWFPDPFARYEHRYWDGSRWTEHVGTAGRRMLDAPVTTPAITAGVVAHAAPATSTSTVNKCVKRQVQKLGMTDGMRVGGGTLLTEQILVVNQKVKLFE